MTADDLRRLLHYDPATGVFTWLVRSNGRVPAGSIAGSTNANGYIDIGIGNSIYKASRLAWLYMTGEWPSQHVDHENLIKTDNRWRNLRQANRSLNGANRPKYKNNTSGFKGVTRSRHQWQAQLKVLDRKIWLGRFDTPEEAHAAYVAAAQEHFGEFARAG